FLHPVTGSSFGRYVTFNSFSEIVMPRLSSPSYRDASGPAAEIFSQIKKSIGSVPNVYAVIGSNSPHALKALLSLNA
ncbi:hypothetical protein SB773_34955, partial [Bacillus sp. SIMBA_074]|uniref:hypothetical protein n=1 Tax=Bacillus sp. SIMBA_074 TaxID=3085812 RepID=UPI00397C1921